LYEGDKFVREYATNYVAALVWKREWTTVDKVAREWLRWDSSNIAP
jgi:hypothetical protein